MLTTQVDAIGVGRADEGTLWCIELKTTAIKSNKYPAYADSACKRTPTLRCTPVLPNSEKCRHFVQAGYGAMSLARVVGKPVKAVVVVSCSDNVCLTFVVPPLFQCETLFRRLPRIPISTKFAVRKKPSKPTTFGKWPTIIAQKLLKKSGLVSKRPQLCTGVLRIVDRANKVVGVAAYIPNWHCMGDGKRSDIRRKLTAAAGRCKSYPDRRSALLSMYVLSPLTEGGTIRLAVAGPPV